MYCKDNTKYTAVKLRKKPSCWRLVNKLILTYYYQDSKSLNMMPCSDIPKNQVVANLMTNIIKSYCSDRFSDPIIS
jgi:hypothetical protein